MFQGMPDGYLDWSATGLDRGFQVGLRIAEKVTVLGGCSVVAEGSLNEPGPGLAAGALVGQGMSRQK